MRHSLLLPAGALALWTAACSASSSHSGAVTNDAGTGDDAGDQADAPAPCSAPPDMRPAGGTCVLDAKGTVFDLSGTSLGNIPVTMCSPTICYGGLANGAGAYDISIGDFVVTANYAVHADGRPDHAVDYLRLAANEPEVIQTDMHLPTLPLSTVSLPADGAPASTVTVGDVSLLVAAGTTFMPALEDYETPTGRILRVAAVPLASAPPYAAANQVDAIYALAPSGTKPSVKMGVSVRNSANLAASAAVDILVLSDDYFSTPPTVGTLVLEAAAHVSADGTTIQTDPGEGIDEITWLAVRLKGK